MSEAVFKQHQHAFTAHLRDPEKNALPAGIEDRRMAVYRELLYNNIENFIANGFPVIRKIYNEKNWHKMVRDFFANHRSHTPYFLKISEEFIQYLEKERTPQAEDPAGLLELAHYEWIEIALHISTETIDMTNVNANGDLLKNPPVFSPLAWSLAYQFPVHLMGPDYLPKVPPEQASHLVVYRNNNDQVKFLNITPATARLINLFEGNAMKGKAITGEQAIDIIIHEIKHPDANVVKQGGKTALEQLRQYGIILGTSDCFTMKPVSL